MLEWRLALLVLYNKNVKNLNRIVKCHDLTFCNSIFIKND